MQAKSKKVLYVDVPFLGLFGGDKNRSSFLYKSLVEEYDTDVLLIADQHYNKAVLKKHKKNKLFLMKISKGRFYHPSSLYHFDEKQKNKFKKILLGNQYDIIVFKFNSMALLANLSDKILPFSNIIIDVDMLSSRICKEAWSSNKSFKNRYFLIEYIKHIFFEKKFLNQDYTYLYTNNHEMPKNKPNHKLLPNVINEIQDNSSKQNYQDKYILFYGMLSSTVNQSAYEFLIQKIYPLIKNALLEQNVKILIIGKNRTSIHNESFQNIEVLGEVENLQRYIQNCLFVFLPLQVASGTLTRVLEVSFLKKSVLTTPIGAEGLEMQKCLFIEKTTQNLANKVIYLMNNKSSCNNNALKAYQHVIQYHSAKMVALKLYRTIELQKKRQMNVVHIPRRFTSSHWGGTENVIVSYAKGLKQFNVNSEIYTSKILNDSSYEQLQGVNIHRFSYFYPYFNLSDTIKEQLNFIGGNIFSFTLLFSLLFKNNIDLIHLHTFKRIGGIARLICKIKNIPYVVSIHGGLLNRTESPITQAVTCIKKSFEWGKILGFLVGSRRVIKDSNAVICLNNQEFNTLKEQKLGSNLFLINNGVNIKLFAKEKNNRTRQQYHIDEKDFVCLVSARIDPQKNQLLLLKVLNKIKNSYTNLHILFLGNITSHTYHQEIKSYIKKHSLQKKVSIITNIKPESKELIDVYLSANALILPSVHEPFGIVALEAWASSLPVIISSSAGICNLMRHEDNALIFENNCKQSLKQNLILLLENPILQKTLINNGKKRVFKFDHSVINQKIYSIYTHLVCKV